MASSVFINNARSFKLFLLKIFILTVNCWNWMKSVYDVAHFENETCFVGVEDIYREILNCKNLNKY